MIDHVSIAVSDLASAGALYDAVLDSIGIDRLVSREQTIGYGKRYPEFWLNLRTDIAVSADPGTHICLRARDRDAVDAFHKAALAGGATDAGAPGERAAAMGSYYGTFILDPWGNKVEALTFPRPDEGGAAD